MIGMEVRDLEFRKSSQEQRPKLPHLLKRRNQDQKVVLRNQLAIMKAQRKIKVGWLMNLRHPQSQQIQSSLK
jgi:hypothetical protein